MISRIALTITDWLRKRDIIVQEEYEIYLFGMEQLLSSIMNMVSVLIIGMILGVLLESIIFLMAFKFIRQYAGGYHASTRIRCYLLSIMTIITVLSVIKYVSMDEIILVTLSGLASIVILLLSPIDTENRRIDAVERIYYRKKTIIIWVIELFIAVMCMIVHFYEGAKCIVLALLVLAMALSGEKLKGKIIKNGR